MIDYKELIVKQNTNLTADRILNAAQSITNQSAEEVLPYKISIVKITNYNDNGNSQLVMPSVFDNCKFLTDTTGESISTDGNSLDGIDIINGTYFIINDFEWLHVHTDGNRILSNGVWDTNGNLPSIGTLSSSEVNKKFIWKNEDSNYQYVYIEGGVLENVFNGDHIREGQEHAIQINASAGTYEIIIDNESNDLGEYSLDFYQDISNVSIPENGLFIEEILPTSNVLVEKNNSIIEDSTIITKEIQAYTGNCHHGEESIENYDMWNFEFAGGVLKVAMESDEYDTFIKLHDSNLVEIKTNDDGGFGYNSKLVYTLAPGVYNIKATGPLRQSGPYKIEFISEVIMGELPDGCEVVENATYDYLQLVGETKVDESELTSNYKIEMSNISNNLGILTNGESTTTEGVITIPWEYLVENNFIKYLSKNKTKAESFKMLITDIDENNEPLDTFVQENIEINIIGTNDAPYLRYSESIIQSNVSEDSFRFKYEANNEATESSDRWVFSHPGGKLDISMNSTEFDTFLLLYNEDDDESGIELKEDDDSGIETNARLQIDNLEAGIYKIIASGYRYNTGNYEILFNSQVQIITTPATSINVTNLNDLKTTGHLLFTEIDNTDNHTATTEAHDNIGRLSLSLIDSDTLGTGEVHWEYLVQNSRIQYLNIGEQLIEIFTILLKEFDDEGNYLSTIEQEIEVVILGTNDQPAIIKVQNLHTIFKSYSGNSLTGDSWVFDHPGGDLKIVSNSSQSIPRLRLVKDGDVLSTSESGCWLNTPIDGYVEMSFNNSDRRLETRTFDTNKERIQEVFLNYPNGDLITFGISTGSDNSVGQLSLTASI
ncbi:MAG: hypothetical protein DRG78_09250 [Epsilonproteobacteria bacterium]|nr:MAG: hypothetical protein DRG78_09250 [Campylobacterota bacterium]